MPKPENVLKHRRKKGDPPLPGAGRPRKYVSALREQGYSRSEVIDCYCVLAAMSKDELREVAGNPLATVLELNVAEAILNDLKYKRLNTLAYLVEYVHGKATQHVTQDITVRPVVTYNVTPAASEKLARGLN